MPPLITPSPTILDQSFPKSDCELDAVSISLGELQLLFEEESIHFLLTDTLAEWVLDYEWSPSENCSKLNQIYQMVSNLFLSATEGIVRLDLATIECDEQDCHPLRDDYCGVGWSEIWSHELGKLHKIYKSVNNTEEEYIAIACEYGFSGSSTKKITDDTSKKSFKIVGKSELSTLSDAYQWVTEAGLLKRSVPFSEAKKIYIQLVQ